MNRDIVSNGDAGRRRLGALIPGLILIFLGVWFLLDNLGVVNINLGQLWPIFPIIIGFSSLAGGLIRSRNGSYDDGAIMVGVWGLLIGLFFMLFTFGVINWGEMGRLWPTFPLIGGIGFLAAFLAGGLRDWGLLVVGGIATTVGILGYVFAFGVLSATIAEFILPYLVPIALIIAGIGVLASGLMRRKT